LVGLPVVAVYGRPALVVPWVTPGLVPRVIVGSTPLTVTVTWAVLLQLPVVPVTVYIVVDAGPAVTIAPEVADNPVDGAHE
jgi:hypothetical protein